MEDALREASYPLDDGRLLVPEPIVKDWLAGFGVAVPERGTDTAPLVLKAYGPGIVHKSDMGAVRLGLAAEALGAAREAMGVSVAAAGATVEGFLVEAQVDPGVELIVGVIVHPVFGPLLAVGSGGVLAEVLDDVALRPLPVGPGDVGEMLDGLRAAPLLAGHRGAPPADREALVAAIMGVATAARSLGPELGELECNPVIAGPTGAVAADARLVLVSGTESVPGTGERRPAGQWSGTGRSGDRSPDAGAVDAVDAMPGTDFGRLFRPRGVAVAGASASKSIFGNWLIQALRDYGRTDLAAIHPTAAEIEGVAAYPSVDDVPHDVDYVIAAVPAPACADLVATCGRAEFVHVISGGFREAGEDALEQDLLAAGHDAGVRLLGPNCMGVFSPAGRLTFQLDAPTRTGEVSIVSQSGGLAGDLVKLGAGIGLGLSKLVSIGNAVDVGPGELVRWLIDDPETEVVGLYVEDPRDGTALVDGLRAARGRVPVVVLAGGTSTQGGRAVASHTGALAAEPRIWQGIAAATGATLVSTLEELVGTLRYLQRHRDRPAAARPDVLIGGVGGGATVLAADACDRAGLDLTILGDAAQQALRELGYGVGTSVVNPVEIPVGPKVAPQRLADAVRSVLAAQAFDDVLVHLNVQSYYSFGDGGPQLVPFVEAIGELAEQVPVALVLRNLSCAPGRDREAVEVACVEHGVVPFATLGDAATAIAAAQSYSLNKS